MKTLALQPFYDWVDRNIAHHKEQSFRRFERALVRNERFQLIKKGVIIPEFRMPPQLMVRNENVKGGWSPEIKRHG